MAVNDSTDFVDAPDLAFQSTDKGQVLGYSVAPVEVVYVQKELVLAGSRRQRNTGLCRDAVHGTLAARAEPPVQQDGVLDFSAHIERLHALYIAVEYPCPHGQVDEVTRTLGDPVISVDAGVLEHDALDVQDALALRNAAGRVSHVKERGPAGVYLVRSAHKVIAFYFWDDGASGLRGVIREATALLALEGRQTLDAVPVLVQEAEPLAVVLAQTKTLLVVEYPGTRVATDAARRPGEVQVPVAAVVDADL